MAAPVIVYIAKVAATNPGLAKKVIKIVLILFVVFAVICASIPMFFMCLMSPLSTMGDTTKQLYETVLKERGMKYSVSGMTEEKKDVYFNINYDINQIYAIHAIMFNMDFSKVSKSNIEALCNRFVQEDGKIKILQPTVVGEPGNFHLAWIPVEHTKYKLLDLDTVLNSLIKDNLLKNKDDVLNLIEFYKANGIDSLGGNTPLGNKTSDFGYNGDPNLTNLDVHTPVLASIRNSIGQRSRENYAQVIDQFQVATNPRYQKRDGYTYCNIFVQDVLRAMNVGLPELMLAETIFYWMPNQGREYGWFNVTDGQAIERASKGYPTIVVMPIPPTGSNGHICMIYPNQGGDEEVHVAQAGSRNYNYASISQVFSSGAYIKYYTHD